MELRKSFIIIEVLISIFIIFMAIVTIVTSFKQNLFYTKKMDNYQNVFTTVKSIVNLVDTLQIDMNKNYKKIKELNINGFDVKIYAKTIKYQRNFVISSSDIKNLSGGHTGKKLYELFKIKIELHKNDFTKKFFYFLTKVEKQ